MKQSRYSEEELQGTLQELFQEKKRVRELQKRIRDIGEDRNNLKNEIELLKLSKVNLRSSQLENTLNELQDEAILSKKNQEGVKEQLREEVKKNTLLKELLTELKEKLKALAILVNQRDNKEEFIASQNEIKELKHSVTNQKKEIIQSEELITTFKKELQSIEGLKKENIQLQSVLTLRSKQLKEKESEYNEFHHSLEIIHQKLKTAQEELSISKKKIIELQSIQKEQVEQHTKELALLQQNNKTLKEQNELTWNLESKVEEQREKLLKLSDNQSGLDEENRVLTQKLDVFQNKYNQAEDKYHKLQNLLDQKQEELKLVKGTLSRQKESIQPSIPPAYFQEKIAALNKELLKSQELYSQSQVNFKQQEHLLTEKNEYIKTLKEHTFSAKDQTHQLDKINQQLNDEKERYQTIKSKYEALKETQTSLFNKTEEQNLLLKEFEIEKKEQTIQEEEFETLKEELEYLKQALIIGVKESKELEDLYYQYSQEKALLLIRTKEHEKLFDSYSALKKEHLLVQGNLDTSSVNLTIHKKENATLTQKLELEKETHHTTKNTLLQKQSELQKVKESYSSSKEALEKEKSELITDTKKTEEALKAEHTKRVSELSVQNKSLLENNTKLTKTTTTQKSTLESIQQILAKKEKEIIDFQAEYTTTVSELSVQNKSLLENNTKLTKTTTTQKSTLESVQQMLVKKEKEIIDFQAEHTTTVSELSVQNKSLLENNTKLTKTTTIQKSTLESVQQILAKKEKEIIDFQADLSKTKQYLNRVISEQTTNQINIKTLKEELLSLDKKEKESKETLHSIQVHLTKKVRENTQLRETLTIENQKTSEFKQTTDNLKSELKNLEHSLELQHKHENRLQHLITEQTQASREETKKWEDKYFNMHEKWQTSSNELEDLKRIKEEYQKMRQLFGHIQTFFTSSTLPQLPTPSSIQNPSLPSDDLKPIVKQESRNLFENAEISPSSKQTKKGLFD